MSNGSPRLLDSEGKNVVVYAKGYESGCDYDKLVDACGGDDFIEFLGDDVNEMIARYDGAEGTLEIIATDGEMAISVIRLKEKV
jgi:hypothetical protein